MRKPKYRLLLSTEEASVILNSLIHLKNTLIHQGRYTDCVDDLIQKVFLCPIKRIYF
jgi:hypothetical protein